MSISRRYRPRVFADITDQVHIRETLRKEVASGKLSQAYLFSGPRGVGKTTTARIFAKAVNCPRQKDGEPCNDCDLCREANEGRMLDLIEMDAASHTGVENVREAIIEHVRFAPVRGKFKVYILDEAHMLSGSSWNALLKTLEEPPSHVIFILATTELHKVPGTIISRCQRFDFKRIAPEAMAKRIEELAKQEGYALAPAVTASIVRHADGYLRDAETLLGQLVALGEKNITEEVASLVLPVSRLPIAAKLLAICARRELGPALIEVAIIEEEGIPLIPIFDDLVQAVRMLLLAADDTKSADQLRQGDEGERALTEIVGSYTPAELSDMSLLFMERRRDAKQGIDTRLALEMAVTAIALGLLPHGPTPPLERGRQEGVSHSNPGTPFRSSPSKGEMSLFTLSDVQRNWTSFVKTVGEKNTSLTFILTTARPIEVEGATVILNLQYPFHRDKTIGDLKNKRILEDSLREIMGVAELHLDAVVGEDKSLTKKRSEDMVSSILKAFGGQVVGDTGEV